MSKFTPKFRVRADKTGQFFTETPKGVRLTYKPEEATEFTSYSSAISMRRQAKNITAHVVDQLGDIWTPLRAFNSGY